MLFLESLSVPCTMIRVWEIRTPAPAVHSLGVGRQTTSRKRSKQELESVKIVVEEDVCISLRPPGKCS